MLTQLRELVTVLTLTPVDEASADREKALPVMVMTPSVHVALRSFVAEDPSLYRPVRWNSSGEPEQVEGLPTVWSMDRLPEEMLSVDCTWRSMLLLLLTGVGLAHARELVTLTDTAALLEAVVE